MQQVAPLFSAKAAGPVMREVLAVYLESLQFPTFPMPAYLVAYGFEALLQSDLFEPTRISFAEGELKEKLRKSFKTWVNESAAEIQLESPERANEFRESWGSMFSNVLRRSFAINIRALLDQYDVPYEDDWAKSFVRFRNESVHGGFASGKGWEQILRDVRLVEQSQRQLELPILKILGYHGVANNRTLTPHQVEQLPWG